MVSEYKIDKTEGLKNGMLNYKMYVLILSS